MVTFFGIFGPGPLARHAAEEAPAKARFFTLQDEARDDLPLSAAEEDEAILTGKCPGPAPDRRADLEIRSHG